MSVSARQARDPQSMELETERAPEVEAATRAASAWINQFARTLKTCRLYDGNNPTVIRFRDELAFALGVMVVEHGSITYRFHSDDVLFEETSLYPAKSRDDNLALPFYRDGIHAITISAGVDSREVEALIDALLQVSGQNAGDDDLVTLLWQAQLEHISVDYVPSEGDVGSGAVEGDLSATVPWPTGETEEVEAETREAPQPENVGRSDDWTTGDLTVEVEAAFEELETIASSEVKRLLHEYQAEHEVPIISTSLAIANAFLGAGASAEDKAELSRFLPRLLRQAVNLGAWLEARETMILLRRCDRSEWQQDSFLQELLQPISIAGAVEKLDQQTPEVVAECVAFAHELGDPAVDWLNLVLAESQQRRTRRVLAESIAHLCRENPERLAPWLADPRWYVVRNVIHILGWIGGDAIVGMLQAAARNTDPRVRHEVVAALGQVEPRFARPILLRMLEGADTRLFCSILHQLSAARDATAARLLMNHLQDSSFEQRPLEERRAIYSAVSATGGDEVVPELEGELHKGNWFSRNQELHRQAIARCLARIGTPLARAVLERGALSKRGPLRKACEDALAGTTERD